METMNLPSGNSSIPVDQQCTASDRDF